MEVVELMIEIVHMAFGSEACIAQVEFETVEAFVSSADDVFSVSTEVAKGMVDQDGRRGEGSGFEPRPWDKSEFVRIRRIVQAVGYDAKTVLTHAILAQVIVSAVETLEPIALDIRLSALVTTNSLVDDCRSVDHLAVKYHRIVMRRLRRSPVMLCSSWLRRDRVDMARNGLG